VQKKKSNVTILNAVFAHSEDIVSREIEGEIIIVPLAAGIGTAEEELFTLNETGKAIWQKLDGKRRLSEVVKELSVRFRAPKEMVKKDVVGLVRELLKRKMLTEVSKR